MRKRSHDRNSALQDTVPSRKASPGRKAGIQANKTIGRVSGSKWEEEKREPWGVSGGSEKRTDLPLPHFQF